MNYEPAFPTENAHQTGNSTWHHEGMTLRDYFAAKAMQSVILLNDNLGGEAECRIAYQYADAMLKAREEQNHE